MGTFDATTWETLPLLDEGKLAELAGAVGAEVVGTMLAMIPGEAENSLAAMIGAIGEENLSGLRQAAHGLKGLAANFGAARLTALARILEVEAPDVAAASLLMPHLNRAVADTSALIAAR